MELMDLLGREKWQRLLDDLSDRTGVVAMLLDEEAALLLKSGVQNRLCNAIREKEENRTFICAMSARGMTGEVKATLQPVNEFCEAGLKRFTVPVVHEGKFIGQVAGCGIITDREEIDIWSLARQMDLSEEVATQLVEGVGRVSSAAVDQAVAELMEELKG